MKHHFNLLEAEIPDRFVQSSSSPDDRNDWRGFLFTSQSQSRPPPSREAELLVAQVELASSFCLSHDSLTSQVLPQLPCRSCNPLEWA